MTHAVQDFYPDDFAHCYGCGRLNAHGLHLKTRWDRDEAVARFTPHPEHMALPRYVTAQLNVSYLKPTPLGPELEIRARVLELAARKVRVSATLSADGVVTASAEVVAVRAPVGMGRPGS
jgi:hypothetical protein